MGIVYEAEQVSLKRPVAVKVLPKSLFGNEKLRRRFAREAVNAKAIEQLESLRDRQLGGVPVLSALVEAYYFAARYDDVARLAEEILKTAPDEVSVLSTLAEMYNTQAIDLNDKKDKAGALALHQKAFDIRQKLVESHPDSAEFNAELGATINNIGVLLDAQKKTQDALAMFQLGSNYSSRSTELAPQSVLWGRWEEAREAYTTGGPYWSQELCAAAMSAVLNEPEHFSRSKKKFEELWPREIGLDAATVAYHRCLIQCLQPLAHLEAEKLEAELTLHRKELPDWRNLPKMLGMVQYRLGKYSEAIESLQAAPSPERFWQHLLQLNPPLAMSHWQLGEHDQARRVLERSANAIKLFMRHVRESRSSGGAGSANTFLLATFALHKEARTLIDSPEAAAAEFATLFAPIEHDPPLQQTQLERLQAYWDKAVESAGDNPLPLIQRGSWHREQGKPDQAWADFDKARPFIAPESPQRLLVEEAARPGAMKIWNFADPSSVWKTLHGIDLISIDNGVTLQSTHADPYITSAASSPAGLTMVSLCVRTREHLPRAQIFFCTEQYPTFSENRGSAEEVSLYSERQTPWFAIDICLGATPTGPSRTSSSGVRKSGSGGQLLTLGSRDPTPFPTRARTIDRVRKG